MIRVLLFFIAVGLLVAGAVWLADRPGNIVIDWNGWRIDTNVPILVFAVVLLTIAVTAALRLLRALVRLPSGIVEAWRTRGRRKGYAALADGFAAIAAGETARAQKLAEEARRRLAHQPQLTRLLTAQAAGLNGEPDKAREAYEALTLQPGVELSGLRGLLETALARGDAEEAKAVAKRALSRTPNAAWAVHALFSLQLEAGELAEAADTLSAGRRQGVYSPEEEKRYKAALLCRRAAKAEIEGHAYEAEKMARAAVAADPGLVPAVVLQARLLGSLDRERKATSLIEGAWRSTPHPELAEVYMALGRDRDPLALVKRAEALASVNPDHPESRLVVAGACLDAGLWGQARKTLLPLCEGRATARAAKLMARLEEDEHQDANAAAKWWRAAAEAPPEPIWRCNACGAESAQWDAFCPSCNALATLEWRTPARAVTPQDSP